MLMNFLYRFIVAYTFSLKSWLRKCYLAETEVQFFSSGICHKSWPSPMDWPINNERKGYTHHLLILLNVLPPSLLIRVIIYLLPTKEIGSEHGRQSSSILKKGQNLDFKNIIQLNSCSNLVENNTPLERDTQSSKIQRNN